MAVRTAYVATQAAGDVLTSANFSKLPGGWIGYAEVTADQTGITTITDLTSLSVAVTVNTSRRIQVTGHGNYLNDTIDEGGTVYIRESSTTLNSYGVWTSNHLSIVRGFVVMWVGTPSAAAHTYKLSLARTTATGTIALKAAATYPAFILVEDLGPSA